MPAATASIFILFIFWSLIVIACTKITGNYRTCAGEGEGAGIGTIYESNFGTVLLTCHDTAHSTDVGFGSSCTYEAVVQRSAVGTLSISSIAGSAGVTRDTTDEATPVGAGQGGLLDNLQSTLVGAVADLIFRAAGDTAKTYDSLRAGDGDVIVVGAIIDLSGHVAEHSAEVAVRSLGDGAVGEVDVNVVGALLEEHGTVGIVRTCIGHYTAEAAGSDVAGAPVACSTACAEGLHEELAVVVAVGSTLGYGTAHAGKTDTSPGGGLGVAVDVDKALVGAALDLAFGVTYYAADVRIGT